MKVLIINSVCGIRSTGRIVVELYKMIKKNGYDCCIAYGRGNAPEDIKTIKIGNKLDSIYHALNTRLFDKHGFNSIKSTKNFIRKIEEYNPDIIHLHNIHGYYINIKILFEYLKKSNKRIIWTLHDCWSFTGHCTYFDYINCEKWKNGCYECPQINQYPKSLKDNSLNNYINKKEIFTALDSMEIVTPSKWLANLVKTSYLGKYDVKVINNGIDLNVFKPLESNFREKYNIQDKFIILGVASILGERKGLKYFFDLSKKLDEQYKIVIVGISRKQIEKLPNNIIGIERTNNINELKEIYTTADVFFNPTMEEVFGMTNIEALACGTPVITFNTGGSPECLVGKCGYVVQKENIEEVYECIDKIKKGMISKIDILTSAHEFDKNKKFKMYMDLYEN